MRQIAYADVRLGDVSQLQSMIDYQERILRDLGDSNNRYREVLKANEALEKKLENATKDLESERAKLAHCESRLTQDQMVDASLLNNEMLLCREYDELEKGISDRDVYIIVLQMKLLAEKEEVEKLKTTIVDLEHKNEKMSTELKRMSQSYNQERCQSLKLSECIRLQGDEIQKIDQLRKELRETKYQNIIIMEERDARIQELDELKKWAEALKTRFDVVERQKNTSIQKTEFVSNNCAVLQDTIRSLKQKLSTTNLELDETKKRNELLVKDCELFKKQRNHALEARLEAVNTRDSIAAEKDSLQSKYTEMLAKRERMNEERASLIQSCDTLHARYEKASDDVIRFKTSLNEKELEVEDLARRLKLADEKNQRNDKLLDKLPVFSDNDDVISNDVEPNEACTNDGDEETAASRRPWRERRMKSLLKSIKHRISGDRADDSSSRDAVGLVAGNVTMDVLQHLLPNLNTRPSGIVDIAQSSTLTTRTMQRQMMLLKNPKGAWDKTERSNTAPVGIQNLTTYGEDNKDELTKLRSASSSSDIEYPEDVNIVPRIFRCRSGDITAKFSPVYKRTNSTQ
ncbi:putative leucine-rich repeat-containing protein DDB_G0290503 isoform X2 [Xenia sp. Carnegie-2017]|nr:putative leucine-rich repeat-containing protein DDB_G0290503 isoform X2 [Xenia sp. Carnegie-2017]XP_046856520.1 putative leucine-rich repeat-containing protein DDB_G0290503 isoform X2 [Xenia sp. Carnegie-2017]